MLTGEPQPRPNGKDHAPYEIKVAAFPYRNEDGELLFMVDRIEYRDVDGNPVLKDGKHKKRFQQRRPDPNRPGQWINNVDGVPKVPYRLPELTEAISNGHRVLIVEGEGKVDLLHKWRVPATCCSKGAKSWTAEHAKHLKDACVIILPDNDASGRQYANLVGASLQDIAASVSVLQLPGLPEKGDIIDFAKTGGTVEQLNDLIEQQAKPWSPAPSSWNFFTGGAVEPARWLIKNILPETGVALMAGQWGVFKTTTALDFSVSVMSPDLPFADHYRVKRHGGVCYIALEGGRVLPARLAAIAEQHRGISGPLPFAWRGDCPPLTDKDAAEAVCDLINEAARDLKRNFDVPVVLVFVDTIIAAAGYAERGDDNDTSATQLVVNTLRQVSDRTGTLAVGIDHFGKDVSTGTRGSSAKEGGADTVIALLADRELNGTLKNTRLAVRKQRDGVAGIEIPFTVQLVDRSTDEDGDPILMPVIDWQATQQPSKGKARWTPSMRVLHRILTTVLLDVGENVAPFAGGPTVRACNIEPVRQEFYRQYPADGSEDQKKEARRKAFQRAIQDATGRGLVATREVDKVQFIWLLTQ